MTAERSALIAHKSAVLDRHCAEAGRDPATVVRSAQALVVVDGDPDALAAKVSAPVIGGSPEHLVDVIGRYAALGLDEFIVPDSTLGSGADRLKLMDLLLDRVAAKVS